MVACSRIRKLSRKPAPQSVALPLKLLRGSIGRRDSQELPEPVGFH